MGDKKYFLTYINISRRMPEKEIALVNHGRRRWMTEVHGGGGGTPYTVQS